MASRTNTKLRTIKRGFIALLILAILAGLATPAAATPYSILVENPGVWKITGTFDSNLDTWLSPNEISNWTFAAEVLTMPSFNVGPISDTNPLTLLAAFRGSTLFGIEAIDVASNLPVEMIKFVSNPISQAYTTSITATSEGNFVEEGMTNTLKNTTSAVPEPTTALLLLTGLAGLAGYRWPQARRERTEVR